MSTRFQLFISLHLFVPSRALYNIISFFVRMNWQHLTYSLGSFEAAWNQRPNTRLSFKLWKRVTQSQWAKRRSGAVFSVPHWFQLVFPLWLSIRWRKTQPTHTHTQLHNISYVLLISFISRKCSRWSLYWSLSCCGFIFTRLGAIGSAGTLDRRVSSFDIKVCICSFITNWSESTAYPGQVQPNGTSSFLSIYCPAPSIVRPKRLQRTDKWVKTLCADLELKTRIMSTPSGSSQRNLVHAGSIEWRFYNIYDNKSETDRKVG